MTQKTPQKRSLLLAMAGLSTDSNSEQTFLYRWESPATSYQCRGAG
jgi:hypothetical protein